jgi:hypothetical protein
MITYKLKNKATIVLYNGQEVGEIEHRIDGFQYFAYGDPKGGKVYPTIRAAKDAIEDGVKSHE